MKLHSIFLFLLTSIIFAQGKNVEPFLPEIFSQFPNVRDIAMSSDGDEIYFSAQSYQNEVSIITCIRKINNSWSEPEIAGFRENILI